MSFVGKNGLSKRTSIAAFALLSSTYAFSLDPAPIEMGPIDFIPTVKVGIEDNSNIYSQPDDEQASNIFTVRPELLFKAQDRLNTYQAKIYFDSGTYGDSGEGDDDYLDMGLIVDAHWEFNAKNKLDLYFDFEKLHDGRGSEFTAGDPFSIKEPDEYDAMKLGGIYEFGFGENNLYFTIEPFIFDKSYTTNTGDRTDGSTTRPGSEIQDYKSNEIDITAFYRIMPKTTLFFELDAANYDYAEDNPTPAVETLDSSETRYYLGVKWEATAQTTGTAKIGQYSKDFDDDVIDDIDGEFAWDIKLDWTPTENDKITARTGSYIRETEGSGAAIETQDIYLSWVHFWLERLSTKASYRTADDDHGQFSPTFRREDTTDTLEISATYNFKRWMDVSLRYNTESRSSNGEAFEYDRDIIALDFDFSL